MKSYSLESLISATLRIGITGAAILGVIGGAWYLGAYGSHSVSFATFRGTSSAFLSPVEIVREIVSPYAQPAGKRELAVVQLGILLLLATPVMRVALSVVGFALERDKTYVVITSVVLMTLLISACFL
ncbi:MAG: DUF1634 domain-containing protein [Edaphobacter sp.]|uniref:DUF1634 domain-containing protein n=1 Tax=Edaphobacter sp. TaxID=1934404 RepID=UPI0023A31660|nr:DUF1634 domain-containing protein [Edaphobacter sp.]MDE1177370.1 DUF1634 domain-containing protein [Edaphobacter sp.]